MTREPGNPRRSVSRPSAATPCSPETSPARPRERPSLRSDHILRLGDGRELSYALYGPSDGRPVFFLHGLPSCRLEAEGIASAGLLEEVRVRLIVPDRPGFGRSSAAPGRTILSYLDDIEALALHLGLEDGEQGVCKAVPQPGQRRKGYAVIGGSGGGPYAAACAFEASQAGRRFSNLLKVGLFAAAPPYVSPVPTHKRVPSSTSPDYVIRLWSDDVERETQALQRDWMLTSKLMFGLARRFPLLSRTLALVGINGIAWLWTTRWGRRKLEEYARAFLSKHASESAQTGKGQRDANSSTPTLPSAKVPELDREPEAQSAVLEKEMDSFLALSKETWRQGPDGWLDEVRLLGAPWGFDPAGIRCLPDDVRPGGLPFKIWHGAEDSNAPLTAVRWLAERVDGSELLVVEGKGHFGLGGSLHDMLEWAGRSEDVDTGPHV